MSFLPSIPGPLASKLAFVFGPAWIIVGTLSIIALLYALLTCWSGRGARVAYGLARIAKWGGLAAAIFGFNAVMFDTFMDDRDFREALLVVLVTCVLPVGGFAAQLLARRTLRRVYDQPAGENKSRDLDLPLPSTGKGQG